MSIDLIRKESPDYEFRTTVVPTFHNETDIEQICKYAIKDSKRYILQNFWSGGDLINSKVCPDKGFSQEKLEGFAKIAQKYVQEVKIRNLSRNL